MMPDTRLDPTRGLYYNTELCSLAWRWDTSGGEGSMFNGSESVAEYRDRMGRSRLEYGACIYSEGGCLFY